MLALQREEDAPPLLAHIAMAKASTVVVYGRPTTELGAVADEYPVWFGGIRSVAQSAMGMPLIGSKGGRPIRDESGQLLGAIGIAGETGDQDDVLGKLGVETAGFTTG